MRLSGLRKYAALSPLLRSPAARSLPPRFLLLFLSMMRNEKLTRLGDRLFINTHFAPIGSRSAETALANFARVRRGEAVPFSVFISLTDECPYACSYCSNRKPLREPGLPLSALRTLIAQIQDAGASCIGFTGGEPLLREDLEDIVAAVDERSYTILFTSGAGLTKERAENLRSAGLTVAAVSLDSAEPVFHDAVRGARGAYDAACGAIGHFSRAGVYTSVSCVISEHLLHEHGCGDLLRTAGSLGAHELRFLDPLVPAGSAGGDFSVTTEMRRTIMAFRSEANRDRSLPSVSYLSHIESPSLFGCGAGRHHHYINAKGELCPCDFVQVPFGSAVDETFDAVYRRMSSALPANAASCLNARLRSSGRECPSDGSALAHSLTYAILEKRTPAAFRALGVQTRTKETFKG